MKKVLIPVIALTLAVLGAFTARAEWKQQGTDYYYYDGNNLVVNKLIDDEYYVDSTGKMVTNQWLQMTDSEGTFYYYFGNNGKMVRGKWLTIGEKTYHFDDNGRMETGWILDNMYFCHYDDGHMLTGWQRLEDPIEYTENNNSPNVGETTNIHWYYFSSNGKKVCATDTEFFEKRIEGKRYCFNQMGALQVGWVKVKDLEGIGGYKYYDQDGTDHVGWYSLNPPEELASNYAYDVMWFYFNPSGDVVYDDDGIPTINDIKRINNKRYYFNVWGTPVWGLCKLYTDTSGADYETFFFGSMNVCCAQKGKFTITEGDGTKTDYYFGDNGIGYTGVRSGSLYFKGKLQKADTDASYEVVNVDKYNYLVNVSGKVQKKKTLKDKMGNTWETDSVGTVIKKNGETYTGGGRAPSAPVFDK